jgi:hypothetical protein
MLDEGRERKCAVKECNEPAYWTPELIVSAGYGEPAALSASIPHCAAHKASATAEAMITDEGWDMLADVFVKLGRVEPKRELTKLRWIAIE